MKIKFPRILIKSKLSLLLLIFVLIFYGTIVQLLLNVRKMMALSQKIVSIDNVITDQAKILNENLLEMDANAKKFSVLHKGIYYQYFLSSKDKFDTGLTRIKRLADQGYTPPTGFIHFETSYRYHFNKLQNDQTAATPDIHWVDDTTLDEWLALIAQLRDSNQSHTKASLLTIHDLTLRSIRDGLLGFGFSVLSAFFGVWFISKSILRPLRQLTVGLRTLSQGDYTGKIEVVSKDEFQDLAAAFNDMNRQLREEENLRTDFIASLSHEIRTPLSSIQESVNMMAEQILGPVNKRQHKFLIIASSEISRINTLLDRLMQVSMLEVNPPSAGFGSLDPKELVQRCLHGLTSGADRKNVQLLSHFQTNLPAVLGVREEILQVLLNIVGNAVKFSPNESKVCIVVEKAAKSGHVLFQVHDEGPGIPEDEQSLIFNKYYRGSSIRNHMDGMGLGLYISRKIVQSSGGTISVYRNAKRGNTFSFTLPVAPRTARENHFSMPQEDGTDTRSLK